MVLKVFMPWFGGAPNLPRLQPTCLRWRSAGRLTLALGSTSCGAPRVGCLPFALSPTGVSEWLLRSRLGGRPGALGR